MLKDYSPPFPKALVPCHFYMTLITRAMGFPTDSDPEQNTNPCRQSNGSHVLGAPSRDTRALARIRPEPCSRGEHRGIGKACYLAALKVLKHASAQLLLTAVSAGNVASSSKGLDCLFGAHSIPVHALRVITQFPASTFPCAPPASVRSSSVRVGRREPRRLA